MEKNQKINNRGGVGVGGDDYSGLESNGYMFILIKYVLGNVSI